MSNDSGLTLAVAGSQRRITLDQVRPLTNLPWKPVAEVDEEQFQQFMQGLQTNLEQRHAVHPDLSNNPAYKEYARVMVDGKVIAKIDNNGFVESSNAVGTKIQKMLPGDINGKTGPVLAEARAAAIAKLYGGKVTREATAMTQSAWEAVPRPQITLDRAAMQADPMYETIQQLQKSRAAFLAQQMAQAES